MKTKIFAVMATGIAILFMGAAPNSNNNKKSQNARPNADAYVCGYYVSYAHGRMMNGAAADSTDGNGINCPYRRGYTKMNSAVDDGTDGSVMRDCYGRGYGMMGGMRYGMMNGGRYGMMEGCSYVMMPMMIGMMRGRMMYGTNDSSFVCPYANHNTRLQRQKEGK